MPKSMEIPRERDWRSPGRGKLISPLARDTGGAELESLNSPVTPQRDTTRSFQLRQDSINLRFDNWTTVRDNLLYGDAMRELQLGDDL